MKAENLKLKIESYFNCSSLLRREAGREGKKGFTLAEILIALTVIGVISAVTVPVLMQNTNKQEYVTGLKKAYSTLSQASNQIIAEEGSPKGADSWLQDLDSLYDMYKKHLSNARECGTSEGCLPRKYKQLHGGYDPNHFGASGKSKRILTTADGASLYFDTYNLSNGCGAGTEPFKYCARMIVDVNGYKAPNMIGRDAFQFILMEDRLVPAGCLTYETSCNPADKTQIGWACTCKVLKEGAMNY